jgi:hypothetical protein
VCAVRRLTEMRDPARIDKVLEAVRQRWMLDPGQRFGQIVVNVLDADPFYIEDDVALRKFRCDTIRRQVFGGMKSDKR